MGRILLLVIIAFLVWGLFRGFLRLNVRGKGEAPAARSAEVEDMVACARCGVNMPRSEARVEDGAFYCRDNPRCIASR
ncbi:MAG: PP0621 family protein [Usitatibacter sp.]